MKTGRMRRAAPRLFALAPCLLALALAACSTDEPASSTNSGAVPGPGVPGPADPPLPPLPDVNVGSIQGHVAIVGTAPGNRVIRMGMDPKCSQMNQGKRVVDAEVVTNRAGDLANVFVHLEGDLPVTTVPAEPVQIDQLECVYIPRVIGARVGQTVEIRNSDDLLHNLHSYSRTDNGFNVGQPRAGLVYSFQPGSEDIMLRVGCDLHRWMTSYMGIVNHAYFSVTPGGGVFRIGNVPAGTYTIHAWHEVFGELSQEVRVSAEETTTVEFEYSADSGAG